MEESSEVVILLRTTDKSIQSSREAYDAETGLIGLCKQDDIDNYIRNHPEKLPNMKINESCLKLKGLKLL